MRDENLKKRLDLLIQEATQNGRNKLQIDDTWFANNFKDDFVINSLDIDVVTDKLCNKVKIEPNRYKIRKLVLKQLTDTKQPIEQRFKKNSHFFMVSATANYIYFELSCKILKEAGYTVKKWNKRKKLIMEITW